MAREGYTVRERVQDLIPIETMGTFQNMLIFVNQPRFIVHHVWTLTYHLCREVVCLFIRKLTVNFFLSNLFSEDHRFHVFHSMLNSFDLEKLWQIQSRCLVWCIFKIKIQSTKASSVTTFIFFTIKMTSQLFQKIKFQYIFIIIYIFLYFAVCCGSAR